MLEEAKQPHTYTHHKYVRIYVLTEREALIQHSRYKVHRRRVLTLEFGRITVLLLNELDILGDEKYYKRSDKSSEALFIFPL